MGYSPWSHKESDMTDWRYTRALNGQERKWRKQVGLTQWSYRAAAEAAAWSKKEKEGEEEGQQEPEEEGGGVWVKFNFYPLYMKALRKISIKK